MAFIRDYAAMSGDPGRRRHHLFGKLRLPKAIRKFHPTGLLKAGLLGAVTLPFGGAGLALRGARGLAGLARGAGSLAARGGRAALRIRGAVRSAGSSILAQIHQLAGEYGVDPDQLAAAAVDAGVIDESDLEDDSGEAGDYLGDPGARRVRAPKSAARPSHTRSTRHGKTKGPGQSAQKLNAIAQALATQGPLGAMSTALPGPTGVVRGGRAAGGFHTAVRRKTSWTVKNSRHMNPANAHAVRRATRRLVGFQKMAERTEKQLRHIVAKSHVGRRRSFSGGHKPGCKCVACRHR